MDDVPKFIDTFGDLVRWGRDQKKWSIRELARHLHVSAPFVTDVEHNRRMIKDVNLLSRVLDIGLDEIYVRLHRVDTATKEFLATHPEVMMMVQKARASCRCKECRPPEKK